MSTPPRPSPKLQPGQRQVVATLWRADPSASQRSIALQASRLLGRIVTEHQVRNCVPPELFTRKQGRRRFCETDSPFPEPTKITTHQGLSYSTPLENLILESKVICRRLGLTRKSSGVVS